MLDFVEIYEASFLTGQAFGKAPQEDKIYPFERDGR